MLHGHDSTSQSSESVPTRVIPQPKDQPPRVSGGDVKFKLCCAALIALSLASWSAWADSLELKNGSLIKGKYIGGTETEVTFQVGSSIQKYNVTDIVSLKFDSDKTTTSSSLSAQPSTSVAAQPATPVPSSSPSPQPTLAPRSSASPQAMPSTPRATPPQARISIPAGTRVSIRTIDAIDSTKNSVGDRFQASLEEPLVVDGNIVVAKGADVYGRLAESKTSGTFAGRSQLRLELTSIAVNGQTVPLVTGEYEMTGDSRTASTAKRSVGGAAVGSIIGAIAGGGKGAAIGAGVGAGVGAGSQIITKGDQVKVPSETLLDFTLEQELTLPATRAVGH
jgi:hypothetical protein